MPRLSEDTIQVAGSPSEGEPPSEVLVVRKPKAALLDVVLLSIKDEAEEEIKKLLVQINDDSANFPL